MVLATVVRLEFSYPGVGIFSGDSLQYLSLVTAHGVIMVFFMIMPLLLGAFANFLLPTQLGVHDVAFPRLNSAAFWFLPAGLLMLAQLVCIDTRYQRMNCFNICELQSLLKNRFFFDLITQNDHHVLTNNTMISLKHKVSDLNVIHNNTKLLYYYGLTISPKNRSIIVIQHKSNTPLLGNINLYNLIYLMPSSAVIHYINTNIIYFFNLSSDFYTYTHSTLKTYSNLNALYLTIFTYVYGTMYKQKIYDIGFINDYFFLLQIIKFKVIAHSYIKFSLFFHLTSMFGYSLLCFVDNLVELIEHDTYIIILFIKGNCSIKNFFLTNKSTLYFNEINLYNIYYFTNKNYDNRYFHYIKINIFFNSNSTFRDLNR